jgi:hypothetical protein
LSVSKPNDKWFSSVPVVGTRGVSMCDEHHDARMKAFWRAIGQEAELERDEDDREIEPLVTIQPAEPTKGNRKALVR